MLRPVTPLWPAGGGALPSPLWGGAIRESERGGDSNGSALSTPTPALRADPSHKGEGRSVAP